MEQINIELEEGDFQRSVILVSSLISSQRHSLVTLSTLSFYEFHTRSTDFKMEIVLPIPSPCRHIIEEATDEIKPKQYIPIDLQMDKV